ncbi:hypothetical protein DSECCO2_655800 [anaerobic digester metagenome]
MGEPDLVDEVGGPADRLLRRIADVVERPQDVLDHPVVAVEGERPLEHDSGPSHDPSFYRRALIRPEIDVHGFEFAATDGARLPSLARDADIIARTTGDDMIDDRSLCRGLVHAPHKVHKNGLAGPASPDYADCLSLRYLKMYIFEYNSPVELHAEVLYRNEWGHLEFLVNLIFSWYHIRVYIVALFPLSVVSTRSSATIPGTSLTLRITRSAVV